MRIAFLLMMFFSICSCGKKEKFPADIIKPEKMKLIMWDFMKADVYAEELIKREHPGTDTLENMKLQLMIFNKYQITRQQFYKSYHYYYSHTDLMNALLDSITASQNRIKIIDKD